MPKVKHDYRDLDFPDIPERYGYYLVRYQNPPPMGPFEDLDALVRTTGLLDYPDDGYIVQWTGEADAGLALVPSLNPDLFRRYRVQHIAALTKVAADSLYDAIEWADEAEKERWEVLQHDLRSVARRIEALQ